MVRRFALILILFTLFFALFQSYSRSILNRRQSSYVLLVYTQTFAFLFEYDFVHMAHTIVPYHDYTRKTIVPGGYGAYKLHALHTLSIVEKDFGIIQRAFAQEQGRVVDFYIIDMMSMKDIPHNTYEYIQTLKRGLYNIGTRSNISLFDRVILLWFLSTIDMRNVKVAPHLTYTPHEAARREKALVQILYHHEYESARKLARILEGVGIRVADISINTHILSTNQCVLQSLDTNSYIAQYISYTFGCKNTHITTTQNLLYDHIFILNSYLERIWK